METREQRCLHRPVECQRQQQISLVSGVEWTDMEEIAGPYPGLFKVSMGQKEESKTAQASKAMRVE